MGFEVLHGRFVVVLHFFRFMFRFVLNLELVEVVVVENVVCPSLGRGRGSRWWRATAGSGVWVRHILKHVAFSVELGSGNGLRTLVADASCDGFVASALFGMCLLSGERAVGDLVCCRR